MVIVTPIRSALHQICLHVNARKRSEKVLRNSWNRIHDEYYDNNVNKQFLVSKDFKRRLLKLGYIFGRGKMPCAQFCEIFQIRLAKVPCFINTCSKYITFPTL